MIPQVLFLSGFAGTADSRFYLTCAVCFALVEAFVTERRNMVEVETSNLMSLS